MHAEGPGLKRRYDIRFQRIADHQALRRAMAVPLEQAGIDIRRLLADDLDGIEQIAKAGLGELALLIEEIALGDDHQAIAARQRLQRFAHPRQRLDRMRKKIASALEDRLDGRTIDTPFRDLDGGFDHRQREALHPVAIDGEVAALGFEQALLGHIGADELGEDQRELLLRQLVEGLMPPERIIRIKSDGGDGGKGMRSDCRKAVIDEKMGSIDEARFVAGEETGAALSNFLRRAHTALLCGDGRIRDIDAVA